jgi:hypothetical protein
LDLSALLQALLRTVALDTTRPECLATTLIAWVSETHPPAYFDVGSADAAPVLGLSLDGMNRLDRGVVAGLELSVFEADGVLRRCEIDKEKGLLSRPCSTHCSFDVGDKGHGDDKSWNEFCDGGQQIALSIRVAWPHSYFHAKSLPYIYKLIIKSFTSNV